MPSRWTTAAERARILFDKAVILTGKEFDLPRLNVVAIDCVGPSLGGWVAGLPDDAFEHDGQLTKRDLRASALARLSPTPGEHLWDVGAGAGSVETSAPVGAFTGWTPARTVTQWALTR